MAIIYEKKGNIAFITINRPEVMNALDSETMHEIIEARQDFNNDDQMQVCIITGAGERAFSTGADLKKTMPPKGDPSQSVAAQFWKPKGQLYYKFFSALDIFKPMIAAIRGYCLAGGFELALSCDIRVASQDALFGMPEVQIGSMPGGGTSQRLTRILPLTVAMKILLTGERINAQQALQWGLVTDVVPPSEVIPTAERIAQKIADNGPLGVGAMKEMVVRRWGIPPGHAQLIGKLLFGMLRDTEDRIEGRRAFAEKRKPTFKGM